MHILIIPSWYPPNGGDFFRVQAEKIMEHGHTVSVIYVEECSFKQLLKINPLDYLRVQQHFEKSLKVYRTKFLRFPFLERFNFQYQHIKFLQTARFCLKHEPMPDISHVHSSVWGGYVAYKLWKKHNIPYIVTEHRGRFNAKHKLIDNYIRTWFPKYMTRILTGAKKIIPVSKYQIEGLQNSSTEYIPPEKFRVIPNLYEPKFQLPNLDLRNDVKHEKIIFLSVAVFHPYKGHEILLESCQTLIKKGYTNFEFRLAGSGISLKTIKIQVNSLNLNKYIKFLGFCNFKTLMKEYLNADYMVLSSRSEGQPVAILESFAMGLPVIVPDLVTDDVVNPTNSIVFKTGDSEALSLALIDGLEGNKKFDGKVLQKYAITNFTPEKIIPQIVDVYKETLAK